MNVLILVSISELNRTLNIFGLSVLTVNSLVATTIGRSPEVGESFVSVLRLLLSTGYRPVTEYYTGRGWTPVAAAAFGISKISPTSFASN